MDLNKLACRPSTRLFVDTCFVMNPASRSWITDALIPEIRETSLKVIAPYGVIVELERLQKKSDKKEQANRACDLMNYLKHNNYLEYRGDENDPFTDQTFHYIFEKFRTKYDLVLLTLDNALKADLLQKNLQRSVSSKFKIYVSDFKDKDVKFIANKSELNRRCNPRNSKSQQESKLKLEYQTPRILDQTNNGSCACYKENELVYTNSKGTIQLGKTISSGGEGEVFRINENTVAKIYKVEERYNWREAKISEMVKTPLPFTGVAWPQELIYDSTGKAVGFTMPAVNGIPLILSVFGKTKLENNFPAWNRLDLVKVCANIAKKVDQLHKRKIILGDINPTNFLVEANGNVNFIDVDSYQLRDFPCPVGTEPYTPPEGPFQNFKKFLRAYEHDTFALAVLIFNILLPGKPPYSHQGGESARENIKRKQFPYITSPKTIPPGPWKNIWSHLPPSIKHLFERAFIAEPEDRPSAQEWHKILLAYQKLLIHPEHDSDLQLFPAALRPHKNQSTETLKCPECRNDYTTSTAEAAKRRKYKNTLCNTCRDLKKLARKSGGKNQTCDNCEKLYKIPVYELKQQKVPQTWCDTCLSEYGNSPRTCKYCGKKFTLTAHKIKNILYVRGCSELPKKCYACKDRKGPKPDRTQNFEQNESTLKQPSFGSNTYSSSSQSSPPTDTSPHTNETNASTKPAKGFLSKFLNKFSF